MERYDRQTKIKEVGLKGQEKLCAANICIIGAGGLGSQLLPIFVGAGVGKITIVDFDEVALTNLHRQTLYRENQIGENKALLAKEHLKDLNSQVQITALDTKLSPDDAAELFAAHDLIIDATDNFLAKFLINKSAAQVNKPVIYASVRRFEGQVAYFEPAQGYGLHSFAKEPSDEQAQQEYKDGVLPSQVSIIAAMQAQLALGYIIGAHLKPKLGELIIFDGIDFTLQKLKLPQVSL
ncbi:MAG: HesA/MoeB/ThiF family protein [Alphaproteobacteria bacterium]